MSSCTIHGSLKIQKQRTQLVSNESIILDVSMAFIILNINNP